MAEPWPIHTLVLDMDDTLFAERDYVMSGFAAVGEWVGAQHGVADFCARAWRRFEAGERGMVFNATLAECGLDAGPASVARLVEVYRSHVPRIQLLPEARTLLEWAQPRFARALISDGFLGVQQLKVGALGLARFIPQILLTDAWGREFWKPSPRAYQAVMQDPRRTASGYVYVSDNPRKDFLAPRALGWRTVRIRRPGGEHYAYTATAAEKADCEIGDLRELMSLIQPESA